MKEETAESWPMAHFYVNSSFISITVRSNWVQVSGISFDVSVVESFEDPCFPTSEECVLFELEYGFVYPLDLRNNIEGVK